MNFVRTQSSFTKLILVEQKEEICLLKKLNIKIMTKDVKKITLDNRWIIDSKLL